MSDYAEEDFNEQITFSHKKQQWIAHPSVIKYICQSDERYHEPHISCQARLQEAKKEHRTNKEMGIAGLKASDEVTDKFYDYHKRLHMLDKSKLQSGSEPIE